MVWYESAELGELGPIVVAASEQGVCMLTLGDSEDSLATLKWRLGFDPEPVSESTPGEARAHIEQAITQMREYEAGTRTVFDVALDARGTEFQKAVWDALRTVPHGERSTYAKIATAVGRANGARAVGSAVGSNPICVIIPCHRIIGSDGSLTGYAFGLAVKEKLLSLEAAAPAAV